MAQAQRLQRWRDREEVEKPFEINLNHDSYLVQTPSRFSITHSTHRCSIILPHQWECLQAECSNQHGKLLWWCAQLPIFQCVSNYWHMFKAVLLRSTYTSATQLQCSTSHTHLCWDIHYICSGTRAFVEYEIVLAPGPFTWDLFWHTSLCWIWNLFLYQDPSLDTRV